jgi:hypothetical protein
MLVSLRGNYPIPSHQHHTTQSRSTHLQTSSYNGAFIDDVEPEITVSPAYFDPEPSPEGPDTHPFIMGSLAVPSPALRCIQYFESRHQRVRRVPASFPLLFSAIVFRAQWGVVVRNAFVALLIV